MLFVAAEKGNKTFVVELIRQYPDIVRMVNDTKQSIFHVAVSHRRKGIYSLLNEIRPIKGSIITLEDKNGNNMLHLATESNQLQDVPGVVLQMQQELLWFKERITKKRTKNEAKTTKPDSEWKSRKRKDIVKVQAHV
ncbi:ankyrin repeat-containing domain, PGG domain protein [Tanacetum coccineum]